MAASQIGTSMLERGRGIDTKRLLAAWILTSVDRERCFCNEQFDVTECSVQGIYKTEDVMKHDPLSMVCPRLLPGWSTDLRSMPASHNLNLYPPTISGRY